MRVKDFICDISASAPAGCFSFHLPIGSARGSVSLRIYKGPALSIGALLHSEIGEGVHVEDKEIPQKSSRTMREMKYFAYTTTNNLTTGDLKPYDPSCMCAILYITCGFKSWNCCVE